MARVTAACDKHHKAMPGRSAGRLEFALWGGNHIFFPDVKAGTPKGVTEGTRRSADFQLKVAAVAIFGVRPIRTLMTTMPSSSQQGLLYKVCQGL